MKVRWLTPVFNFTADAYPHIGAPDGCEKRLLEMVDGLVGSQDLVAIYVTEGAEAVYEPGASRGRIVGAARLDPMPPGKTIKDYFYRDWDGSLRWPHGWPCTVVYGLPIEECQTLRTLLQQARPDIPFANYTSQFQQGPIRLDLAMQRVLTDYFSQFTPIA